MTTAKPHFGNLQKRAKALGLTIWHLPRYKESEDNRIKSYFLSYKQPYDLSSGDLSRQSLIEVRDEIEVIENASEYPYVTDSCGNIVKPSDPDYKEFRDEMRGKTVPVFKPRSHEPSLRAKEALESLKAARIITGTQVLGATDKAYVSDAEAIKDRYRHHIAQLIAFEAKSTIEFTENERVSAHEFLPSSTDTHIVGKIVVMREEDYMKVMSIIKEMAR